MGTADRTDCGPSGTPEECLAAGCCFDDSLPGAIFCFNEKGTSCSSYHVYMPSMEVAERFQDYAF